MAKQPNPKHLNLCTIKEVAQFLGFTEQNIRDRYKNVEGKENHYNSLQLGTYFNKHGIDVEEFFNIVSVYKEIKNNKVLSHKILDHNLK
jgi:transcription initiation factor TFIIIB Brf1 subunit/transcription initiation factor TFIIB